MRLVTALCLLMTIVSADQSGPLRFAIYGDWGVGPNFVPTDPTLSTATLPGTIWKQANLTVPQFGHLYSLTEQAVVSQFQNVSDVYQPQFIISTGDQFYDDGLFTRDDPQYQSKFTSVYTSSGVNVTWYPCLGNHDYYQNPTAELNRTADDWRWYFPSKYYNFSYFLEDGSEVLFVVMDVTPALQKYRKEAGISNPTAKYYHKQMVQLLQAERAAGTWAVQLAWAEQVLTFSRAPWKFVVAHEPVYTSNSLTNEFAELQTDLQPILERTGVSAVFSGHFHTLDISENNNIAYIISGAASQVPYPIGNGTAAALIEYFATVNVTAKVDYGSATPIPSNGTTRYPTEGPLPAVKPVQTPIFTGGNELELPGFMNARLNNTHLHIDIWGLTNDEKWSIVKTYDTLRVDLKPKKQIGPLKFNIIGDWGVGPNFVASNKDDYGSIHVAANLTLQQYGQLLSMTEQAVDTQFKMVSDSFYPQFVISTGDQFYDDGLWTRTDPQFVNKFTRTYNSVGVQVPWYPCLGNHDYYQDPTTELNRTIDDWRWNFPAKYFNFSKYLEDGSEVLFVVMDVNPDLVKYRMEKDIQPGGKYYHKNIVQLLQAAKSTWATQLAWADKVLNSSTAKWKIVVGHEPIYSATGDNSFSELQRDVQPILERNNVTAYLSGHYHTLELVETNMVQYIISGAASQVPYPIGNGTVAGLLDYFNMNPVNTTLPPPSTQVPNVTLSNGTAYPVEAKPPNGVPAQIAYFVGGKEKWLPGFMTATFVNSSVLHIDVYGMGNDTTWSVVARHDILRRDLRVAAPTQTPSTTQPPTTTPTGSTGNNTTPTPGMATTVPPTSTPTTSSNSSSTGMTSSSSSSTGSVYSNGYMVKSSVWMCMMIMIIFVLV